MILDQGDKSVSCRTFHPKTIEYTLFWSAHRTFSRIDHMLGQKTSQNKFKKTGIKPRTGFDHKSMKLEINYKKKAGKPQRLAN